ncbi:esterase-like activity of phytase family protein [Thiothrix sp. UBA2016]|nr:esterase-like activity of phytase family protein [Thiothrix sp. UBA2016]
MKKLLPRFGAALIGMLCVGVALAVPPDLTIHSSLTISPAEVNGIKLTELSALAWDADEQVLYALSDKGRVFHLRLQLSGNTLESAEPVFAAQLLDSKGVPLKRGRADAEGLTVLNANNRKRGDSVLVVALEGEPRLVRFTPQGQAISNIDPPEPLRTRARFQHGNDALESVTFHPRYGFLSAPEQPLKGEPPDLHSVYSTRGQKWSFMAYPAENSGISALEVLPDGNLLVLERAWSGFLNPLVISLRYLDFGQCSRDGACTAQDLQVLSSRLVVDNFEGLTHIQGNQYLMVSDDGDSDWLRTNLTLFTLDPAGN